MSDQIRVSLYGGEKYITMDSLSVIEVINGTALLYLLPVVSGKAGRKLFLAEFSAGERIPSLSYRDDDGIVWKLQVMALDARIEIVVSPAGDMAGCRAAFTEKLKLKNVGLIGFEEAVSEIYRMHQVKDDAFIYQAEKDRRFFYEEGLREILKSFQKEGGEKEVKSSGNSLYQAAKYICEKKKIAIASYDEIRGAEGRDFSVGDIARISNFITRQVKLEGKWRRRDCGYLLGFLKEGKRAVVCEPVNAYRYRMVDPTTGEKTDLTAQTAKRMLDFAYIIYRPLPNEKIGIRQIFEYIAKEISRVDVIRYFFMMLAGTLTGIILTELNRAVFDGFIPQNDMPGLVSLGIMLLFFMIGGAFFGIVENIASLRHTTFAKYNLQAAIYHRTLNLPESVLASVDSADLAGRVMGFSDICISLLSMALTAGVSIFMAVVYFVMMLRYSGTMTAAGVAVLVLYIAATCFLSKRKARHAAKRLELDGRLDSELYQYLLGIEKIRLSGTESNVLYQHIRRLLQRKRLDHVENKYNIASELVGTVMNTLLMVVVFLAISYRNIPLTTGDYMAFNTAYGAFSAAVIALVGVYVSIIELLPEWKRIRIVFDNLPESAQGVIRPETVTGRIDIDNVVFSYDKAEGDVLKGVSVHIAPGEYVGIVGASGSGKSTLLRLLLGFHSPDKGRIYYDNMDLDTLDKRELRKKMGVVLQNGQMISGSIAENIAITAPDIPRERILEIVRRVGLAQDIKNMPMGLNTILDAENPTISGGQKQRILIARALASEPRIVFFDEATSALDNITQSLVCQTLRETDATRLVIAHRLSTVMHCDRILVMEDGRIVEEGTYQQLLAQNGIFAKMAERQTA